MHITGICRCSVTKEFRRSDSLAELLQNMMDMLISDLPNELLLNSLYFILRTKGDCAYTCTYTAGKQLLSTWPAGQSVIQYVAATWLNELGIVCSAWQTDHKQCPYNAEYSDCFIIGCVNYCGEHHKVHPSLIRKNVDFGMWKAKKKQSNIEPCSRSFKPVLNLITYDEVQICEPQLWLWQCVLD